MSGTAVIGLQWGDEAKGKIVDLLTEQNDIVVRYQGGANAGHTVVTGGKTYKLSLIPSGIFYKNVQCILTGGVVINPASIIDEITRLTADGIEIKKNLMISGKAHVIFPWHEWEDALMDNTTTGESIGTTRRGIGPCYRDKMGRSLAMRVSDLYSDRFPARIQQIFHIKHEMLQGLAAALQQKKEFNEMQGETSAESIVESYTKYADILRPYVADTTNYLLDAVDKDAKILFEGAQGSLLDVDHGTFPYVTSSNSSGTGVCSAAGVPPKFLKNIYGICKAYSTRVGGGPFPTEQDNEIGQRIRDRGNEYGTVTKRPRRCGWFDAVAVRYSIRLAGVDAIALTLLDVLSGFDVLNICTAYNVYGRKSVNFPGSLENIRIAEPIYETSPGWKEDISGVRKFDDLPANAKYFIGRISELLGKPVKIVSVGPDRSQTIFI
ncbi:MAG: adenylosuccinate synthase [Planctomycetaceae bacterium]|nr:adenylosuccinate synthase [Planctomycetaceae bacterium]